MIYIDKLLFTPYQVYTNTLSYHDLRHTFATEFYHAELKNTEGQETRSESAAFIVVSERLGQAALLSPSAIFDFGNRC